MKFLLLILLLNVSCASSKEHSWYVKDVSAEERKWHWCHESKDGPDFHAKGVCYSTQKCYKTLFGEHCEPDMLFCAHGDIGCLEKNFWPAVIKF